MEHLTQRQARRIALAAQGFTDPLPKGSLDARHLRRVLGRTQLLQIDSVNVFARAQLMPAFSRLSPWPIGLLDDLAFGRRELFEYWGHEASYLPTRLHPLLRWRMARAEALEEGWGGPLRVFRERPDFVATLLQRLEDEGPCGAGALRDAPRGKGTWWGWDDVKPALLRYPTSSCWRAFDNRQCWLSGGKVAVLSRTVRPCSPDPLSLPPGPSVD